MELVSALRSFVRVTETGSFSAAAHDLKLTQSAVSRQLSVLEAHLDVRLLHRTTSGLSLTAEGERTLPIALRILEAVEELCDATGPEASGRVRLSVPAPLGLHLSERTALLLARHPNLSLDLLFREEPSDLIAEGIDVEVRLGHVADSSLICRRIGWTTAFLVAAPAYLKARGVPRNLDELSGHDCICYRRGGDGRAWAFATGAEETTVRIVPRLVADSAVAVHRAALAGAGLAVLSHILARPDIAAGRLVHLLPEFPPARLPIHVVYPSRRNLPARVKAVLGFLDEVVRADPEMSAMSQDGGGREG